MENPMTINLPIKNPNCAGIDVGSASFFVAINSNKEDVKTFGVSTPDLHILKDYLLQKNISNVAMEATGAYETPLAKVLRAAGIEVTVTAGANTKNYKGIKSDIEDAIHIYELHLLGKLPAVLYLEEISLTIRPLVRIRKRHIECAADQLRIIQKFLREANIRLDVAFSSANNLSAQKIIEAICLGETDPMILAQLAHGSCKKTKDEIIKLLTGHFNSQSLFLIKQAYRLYIAFQIEIANVDEQINTFLQEVIPNTDNDKNIKNKIRSKGNAPKIPIENFAKQILGVDLSDIPGLGRDSLLVILAEIGTSFNHFKSAESFSRWLKLAPNIRSSGKKKSIPKTLKARTIIKNTFRNVANAIGNMKDNNPLNLFFKRIAGRSSRRNAITALAHKVAVICWNMVTKKQPYMYDNTEKYQALIREKQRRKALKIIEKNDFSIQEIFC